MERGIWIPKLQTLLPPKTNLWSCISRLFNWERNVWKVRATVDGSEIPNNHRLDVKKLGKWWDKLPISTGEFTGFLPTHLSYVFLLDVVISRFESSGSEWIMHAKSGYTAYRVPVADAARYYNVQIQVQTKLFWSTWHEDFLEKDVYIYIYRKYMRRSSK